MRLKFLILLLLMLLNACSSVLRGLDVSTQKRSSTPESMTEVTMCSQASKKDAQFIGTNPAVQNGFKNFLKAIAPIELDFTEQVVVWTILQMNVRPDLASPTARLQFITNQDGKTTYNDYSSNSQGSGAYPYFSALEDMIKNHPKKRSLSWYAKLIDEKYRAEILVGRSFESKLRVLSEKIAAQEKMRGYFFRGDEPLRESERIARINFSQLFKAVSTNKTKPQINKALYSYRKTPKLNLNCNYDFTLYDNSIFLIDKEDNSGHIFGITINNKSFLAIASQNVTEIEPLFNQPLFKGTAKVRSSAMCIIKTSTSEVWVTANNSRDPGQHVYHLFRYGLPKAQNHQDIDRLIRHSRHMFLSDPLRLVIESNRSKPEQIQELLKLNVPIYNASSIGNIWAWSNFNNEGGRFYLDDRNPGALFCGQ